ncbi:hypothetical protein [Flavobacterium sp. S87F.05.LMB.W.Kidney.N]|uniref:hypothetical protein n=1 Tax=Flavobacterium sp. S87F.05.LMB.W.Kidney.N TaxID=1278758 RepID=UPI001064CF58|nr:hypothetical protein [Flavobacterium sp. S87F.05.LMB.W.Kidney.N]TDX11184.1 hypothetical protein EDB96_1962 [Flavobacterium sp. S87F.05.LMB.W.Kidney.N]
MNTYTILKWEKLLLWLIPPILRKKTHVEWLDVLLTPLHSLYESILYKMQHTGQVIYLEKVLNEAFNISKNYNPNLSIGQKRQEGLIYIDESIKPSLQYLYLHKEYYNPDKSSDGTIVKGDLRIPMFEIFRNYEYENGDHKPVYLAHREDYTTISYANFRVFIPENLITNQTIVAETHRNSPDQQTQAINIISAEYHNLLNFYKLAGKSYQSYSYTSKNEIQK